MPAEGRFSVSFRPPRRACLSPSPITIMRDGGCAPGDSEASRAPNFVLIVTDNERADALWTMDVVRQRRLFATAMPSSPSGPIEDESLNESETVANGTTPRGPVEAMQNRYSLGYQERSLARGERKSGLLADGG
jgi:hypothetical protein